MRITENIPRMVPGSWVDSARQRCAQAKRLRLRVLTVAGRIIRSGRRRRLRLPRDWPWNHLIHTGYTALHTA